MTTSTSGNRSSYVYAGLAGETAPGRVVKSGLYRMVNDEGGWESLTSGLPEAPAIRAIAAHPVQPEVMYVGTQHGAYRSTDHGNHWEKVNIPDHGLPVWSFMFHPRDPKIMFAGYESCEIYRSDNGGETWRQLPVSVRFPEVTVAPGANPPSVSSCFQAVWPMPTCCMALLKSVVLFAHVMVGNTGKI